jgi:hypothetical protein
MVAYFILCARKKCEQEYPHKWPRLRPRVK